MSSKNETAAVVGVGALACAACCAGPIIGFFGALGLLAGVAIFGTVGLALAALAVFVVLRRRRRQVQACTTPTSSPVSIEITSARNGR